MRSHLIAAATAALVATSARAGPSFDCTKAATPTERLICRDANLSALDAQLAAAFRAAIVRDPAERRALLASQREWLSSRNQTCRTEADCLERAYRNRIAELEANPTSAAAPLCRAIAERYEAWHKRAEADGAVDDGRGLLALADVRDSGVKVSEPVVVLEHPSKLSEWARTLDPPVALPPDLTGNYFSEWDRVQVEKLPGADYYAASSVQGTAHCIYAIYFSIEAGHARAVPGPTNWGGGDGSSCGVHRAFGTVDGVPVAFESAPGSTMLEESLTLSPWGRGRLGPSCSLVFRYAPRFSPTDMANAWEEECVGSRCATLRSAALALVAGVQADPRDAQRRALSKLSPERRSAFHAREAQHPGSPGKEASDAVSTPDQLTDQEPLVLPIVVEGALYRVTVGHITIGWRYFRDWRVTFENLSGGAAPASLAIGMGRGVLLSTAIR